MHLTGGANNVAGMFSDTPPATCIDAAWLNAIQMEIANVILYSGQYLNNSANDTRDQLLEALLTFVSQPTYDYVVTNQVNFNLLFDRIGANHYHIKDAYKSVLLRNSIAGGYLCDGATSFLSGGDTWGYIQTNLCTKLVFEPGTFLQMGNSQGYLEVNTDDCVLDNVRIDGLGAAASAIQRSFLLSAYRATYNNCQTYNRLSNTTFSGFAGSGTNAQNISSRYNYCTARSLFSSGTLYGFNTCINLVNCNASTITCTGAFASNGYYNCLTMSNCFANGIINSSTGHAYGFNLCQNMSACFAISILTASGNAAGYITCYSSSGCAANTIDSTGAGGTANGFITCGNISSSRATDVDAVGSAYGFNQCLSISSCTADGITSSSSSGLGFSGCYRLSACDSNNISGAVSASGFNGCFNGSSLTTAEATNGGNNYMDSADVAIPNKYSIDDIFT